jgi:hypothetical protein
MDARLSMENHCTPIDVQQSNATAIGCFLHKTGLPPTNLRSVPGHRCITRLRVNIVRKPKWFCNIPEDRWFGQDKQ